MSRRYANPPIIEVLCQFNFDSNPSDWTTPGLLYGQIGHLYPRKSGQIQSIWVEEKRGEGDPPGDQIPKLRLRFTSDDGAWIVQVEPNVLVAHHVPQTDAPYPGWDEFRDQVEKLVNEYTDITNGGIIGAALRYINRIEAPRPADGDTLSVGAYLRPGLDLDDALRAGRAVGFEHRYALHSENPSGTLELYTASLMGEDRAATHRAFLLDVEFGAEFEKPLELNVMPGWLDAAHQEVSKTFEACITDEARALFGVEEESEE